MLEITPSKKRNLRSRNLEDLWDLRRWMDEFFEEPMDGLSHQMQGSFKIDVQDLEDAYRVEADLPGVQKDEIKLDYRDGVLSICVNRAHESETEETNYIRRDSPRTTDGIHESVYSTSGCEGYRN